MQIAILAALVVIVVLLAAIAANLGRLTQSTGQLTRHARYALARWEAREDAIAHAADSLEPALGLGGPRQILRTEWLPSDLRRQLLGDSCGYCGADLTKSESVWYVSDSDLAAYCSRECANPRVEAQRAAIFAKAGGRAAMRALRQDLGWSEAQLEEVERREEEELVRHEQDRARRRKDWVAQKRAREESLTRES
jgi:hypothetical protein